METENDQARDTEAEEKIAKAKSAGSKRMSDSQWTDCKIKWASGHYTLDQLSKLYGISVNGIHKRLKRAGINKGQDNQVYEAEMRARQVEEAGEAAAERDAKIRSKAMEAEEFMLNAVDVVSRRGVKAISDAVKAGSVIANALYDIKTCNEAVKMLKTAVEVVQKIRGEDRVDEDELPELVVSGLTQGYMMEIRRAQEEEPGLFGVDADLTESDLIAIEED